MTKGVQQADDHGRGLEVVVEVVAKAAAMVEADVVELGKISHVLTHCQSICKCNSNKMTDLQNNKIVLMQYQITQIIRVRCPIVKPNQ